MRSITINNEPHTVTFEHINVDRLTDNGFEAVQGIRCVVFGEDLLVKGVGFSLCAPEDQWKMGVGYELALDRALQMASDVYGCLRERHETAPIWLAFYRAELMEWFGNPWSTSTAHGV